MAKIQKPLPGLAKFLGIETQGLIRLDALSSVQPVLEIEDYLGPNRWSQIEDAAVVPGGDVSITVPDGKFWRLRWASVTVDAGAAHFCNALINVVPIQTGRSFQLNPPMIGAWYNGGRGNQLFGSSEASGYGVDCRGVNAEPGWQIQAQLINDSGAAVNSLVRLFVQYQQLDL